MGTNHFVASKLLAEEREIQVYLPPSYEENEDSYPVLYVLDGQQFFTHAVSLSTTFRQFDLAPEFIIVGINTSYPQRYRHFSNGKELFIEFMKTELIPYVTKNFRTNQEELLFGWQYAGGLAFNIMLSNAMPFDGYFLASPFPIRDKISELDPGLMADKTLCFSVSPDEYAVNHGTDKLDSLLSSIDTDAPDWTYLQLENEEHHSTAYVTLYHGIRSYFKYYAEFQEDNLEKLLEAGGLSYAYNYAEERGRKYGFSPELSTWSRYTIIRSAIRANHYEHFETFSNEFFTSQFIIDLKNRVFDITDFYEKNGKQEKAIEVYKILLGEFPDSGNIHKKIAEAYLTLGDKEVSEKHFQKAKEIAEEKN